MNQDNSEQVRSLTPSMDSEVGITTFNHENPWLWTPESFLLHEKLRNFSDQRNKV